MPWIWIPATAASPQRPSQLRRLATGRAAVTTVIRIEFSADTSLRPFPWPQRTSFAPEALYIIRSCHEQDNKKIFMSSHACADGYDTPAQQREDKTTFMAAAAPAGTAGQAVEPEPRLLRLPSH